MTTHLSGAVFNLQNFDIPKFPIRSNRIEKYLTEPDWRGNPRTIQFNEMNGISVQVQARDIGFYIEQMPSNCGALILSCIEDGDAQTITFLAKNIASFLGDKVLFLSCTEGRSGEFEASGWRIGHEAYSARYYGYKMHYMFLTLDENQRMIKDWEDQDPEEYYDDYEPSDDDDEPYEEDDDESFYDEPHED